MYATIRTIHPADRTFQPGLFANPTYAVIGLLLAVGLLMGVAAADSRSVLARVDIARFHQIATSEGRPYRDFEVEYAPAETIAIGSIAGGDVRNTAERLPTLAFVCDLLAFAGLWYGWDAGRQRSTC